MEWFYILTGALLLLNALGIALYLYRGKNLPHARDEEEYYNEDGYHIYYDRKLIVYLKRKKEKQQKKSNNH